jgi:hypothetical protein
MAFAGLRPCAIELLERGTGIRDIRDLLGHESVATTRGDAHVSEARAGRSCSCVNRLGHKEALLSPGVKRHGTGGNLKKRAREGL